MRFSIIYFLVDSRYKIKKFSPFLGSGVRICKRRISGFGDHAWFKYGPMAPHHDSLGTTLHTPKQPRHPTNQPESLNKKQKKTQLTRNKFLKIFLSRYTWHIICSSLTSNRTFAGYNNNFLITVESITNMEMIDFGSFVLSLVLKNVQIFSGTYSIEFVP